MAKIRVVQIEPTQNMIFFIDDKGRVWLKHYNHDTQNIDWEQMELPDEPAS